MTVDGEQDVRGLPNNDSRRERVLFNGALLSKRWFRSLPRALLYRKAIASFRSKHSRN
jgi:hypothetical protein